MATLKSQRLTWAGHKWTAQGQLIRSSTKLKPNKSRSRGRPREDLVREDQKLQEAINGENMTTGETRTKIAEAAMGLKYGIE